MTGASQGRTRPGPGASDVAIGVLFVALGVLDVARGLAPLAQAGHAPRLAGDDLLVLGIGVAALVGALGLLRGRSWARWLLAAWMAFHVGISVGRPARLGAHLAIFGGVTFLLFRSAGARRGRGHAAG